MSLSNLKGRGLQPPSRYTTAVYRQKPRLTAEKPRLTAEKPRLTGGFSMNRGKSMVYKESIDMEWQANSAG